MKFIDIAVCGVITGLLVAMVIPQCQKLKDRVAPAYPDTPPAGYSIVTDHHGKWAWKHGAFISAETNEEFDSFASANDEAWKQYEFEKANPDVVDLRDKRAADFTTP